MISETNWIIKYEGTNWNRYFHPKYEEFAEQLIGKWTVYDHPSEHARIIPSLAKLIICKGLSSEIKYRPIYNDQFGPFRNLLPPMCIFTFAETKDPILEILENEFELNPTWILKEETIKRYENHSFNT